MQIENIKKLMTFVSDELDTLTFESFDTVFPRTVIAMKQVYEIKGKLQKEFNHDELKEYEKILYPKAKQIEEKFDNIVEIFSREEERLGKELSATIHRKKLTLYNR